MKKVKNVLSKVALLFFVAFTQVQAWANDMNGDRTECSEVLSQPKFWIGVALFIGFITAFFLMGRKNRNIQLQ